MKDKISIIMCVYNTEKYIEKAIDSVLNQTYSNLELIIVDDNSSDSSNKIIRKKMKKDNRIILIENEKNRGLSYSRNKGLEVSTGEYIGYIDSDDYISVDFYEKLLMSIKKEKSDLAIADIKVVYEFENNREELSKCFEDKLTKVNVINTGLAASACNKLFKKEIISKYKFAEGKVNEDIAVIIPAIVNSKKISYAKNVYYYYIQRNNSIQNSKFSFKRFDIFYGVDLTLERIKGCKDYKKIKDALVFQQLIVMLIYIIPKESNFFYRQKILREYRKYIKKYNVRSNIYYWRFIDGQGRKHKIYFKLLVDSNEFGLNFMCNILIQLYRLYSLKIKKRIVKTDIKIDDIIKLAKKQYRKKSCSKTITVAVPNYNYDEFLYQRIYSILNQNMKINELLLLDDCSTDNSRNTLDEIYNAIKDYVNVRRVYNDINSGSAFKQWEKGINEASSEYVWIAEADDYSDKKFLKNVMRPILKNKNVVISYSDSSFMDENGHVFMKTVIPQIDIMETGHWNKSYVNSGKDEFINYTFLNCTIANVSSAVIKKDDYTKEFKLARTLKQAGDWVFYSNIMQRGSVAYTNKQLNYYRVHSSQITSTIKKEAHLKEIIKIHDYYRKTFGLNNYQEKKIKERYKFLKKAWGLIK